MSKLCLGAVIDSSRLLDGDGNGSKPAPTRSTETAAPRRWRILRASLLFGALTLLASTGFLVYKGRHAPASPRQRTLTRVTFDDGLQIGATWSPDGRFIAYSSDRGGKFDIWVQQVSGGDPVQVTKGPGHNWQPDWSPDGKYIAYRSEEGDGGLYVVPALGGAGLERKISSFGYFPRWSPDSSQILFQTHFAPIDIVNKFYVAHLDGGPPSEVLAEFLAQHKLWPAAAVWHPDGKRVSVWVTSMTAPSHSASDGAHPGSGRCRFQGSRQSRWRSPLQSTTNCGGGEWKRRVGNTKESFPLPGHLRARLCISSAATEARSISGR